MTVALATPLDEYTGNGTTTEFAYNFRLLDSSHLKVYLNGVLQSSGYTVSDVGEDDGTVTFTTAPANGVSVRLQRVVPASRTTDYPFNSGLRAETLNNDFDRLVMMIQGIDYGFLGTASGTDDWDAESQKIVNLATPTASTDAANKSYVDAQVASISSMIESVETSESNCLTYKQNAEDAALDARDHYEDMRQIYYGAYSGNPSTDPNGDPPDAGDMYWNTTSDAMLVYDGGAWVAAASSAYTSTECDNLFRRKDSAVGIGITTPTLDLHIKGSTSCYALWTTGNTGDTSTDGLSIGVDGSSNAIIYNGENTSMYFYTNKVGAAVIDNAKNFTSYGYITSTVQPAFLAYLTSSVTAQGVIAFNNDSSNDAFDTNSNYSTSTGRFTAPVAGRYIFSVGVISESLNAAIEGWLRKNGYMIAYVYCSAPGSSVRSTAWGTVVVTLAANDYVDYYHNIGGVYGVGTQGAGSYFTGALIG